MDLTLLFVGVGLVVFSFLAFGPSVSYAWLLLTRRVTLGMSLLTKEQLAKVALQQSYLSRASSIVLGLGVVAPMSLDWPAMQVAAGVVTTAVTVPLAIRVAKRRWSADYERLLAYACRLEAMGKGPGPRA
jgi:hypothetical protein